MCPGLPYMIQFYVIILTGDNPCQTKYSKHYNGVRNQLNYTKTENYKFILKIGVKTKNIPKNENKERDISKLYSGYSKLYYLFSVYAFILMLKKNKHN